VRSGFRKRSCDRTIERDDDARKNHPALAGLTLGMTIVQEITFAVLAAVGAVAGSEVIVRLWHIFQLLF
jgi:hypothetical protein